jgi:TonB family protein
LSLQAQELSIVDEMPYFPGCEMEDGGSEAKRNCSNQELVQFIAGNLSYPDSARQAGVEGTVYIGFTIEKDGSIRNSQILKDLGYGCGEAALQVLENMPKWIPAEKDGVPVRVDMSLPIRFSLQQVFKNDLTIYWAGINGEVVSRNQLLENRSKPIVVRDREGNSLEILELWMAYRRSFWKKVAQSRGTINPKMRRILWWAQPGGELTLVVTVQKGGKFFEINRVLTIGKNEE